MPEIVSNGAFYCRFGKFTIDAAQSIVTRGGVPVKLAPKTFDLLVFLARNPNQVIDKQTLMNALWRDSFVEDANLAVHISSLRKILSVENGESGNIETFPKIGYRFNAEISYGRPGLPDDVPTEPGADHERSDVAAGAGSGRRRRAIAAAVVTSIVILAAFFFVSRLSGRDSEQTIVRVPGLERSTSIAISPNGDYIAHSLYRDDKYALFMTHVGSGSSVQLLPYDGTVFWGMAFSKDGNFLYYVKPDGERKSLYRVANLGGIPAKILDDVGEKISVSPDGAQFCFVRMLSKEESALMVAGTDGSDVRAVSVKKAPEFYSPFDVAWSPDGTRLAAIAGTALPGRNRRIVAVDPSTGAETQVTDERWRGSDGIEWLPDGSGLVGGLVDTNGNDSLQIWEIPFPAGEPRRITNDLNNYGSIGVSADGRKLIAGQFKDVSRLWLVPAAASGPARPIVSDQQHNFRWVRWTGDGRLAFGSNASGARDVWLMNDDGKGAVRLTENRGSNMMPVGSPDGRFIVFVSNRAGGGSVNLWRADSDGGNPLQLTFGAGENQPAFSPDGKWIFYTKGRIDGPVLEREVWKVPVEGGESVKFVDGPAYGPDVSPDGRSVAVWYKPENEPAWKVAIFGSAGGPPVKLLEIPNGPPVIWTADGKSISFLKTLETITNIWIRPVDDDGPAYPYTEFTSERISHWDWSPDGRLICSRTDRSREIVLIADFR